MPDDDMAWVTEHHTGRKNLFKKFGASIVIETDVYETFQQHYYQKQKKHFESEIKYNQSLINL